MAVAGNRSSVSASFGRYFSSVRYLVFTLLAYTTLAFVTYLWLAVDFRDPLGKSLTVAYDVVTGGNPLAYIDQIKPHFPILWLWLAFFHLIAWLLVPVVVASTVDALYRVHEHRRLRAEQRLRRRIRAHGRTQKALSGVELDDFVDQTMETLEDLQLLLAGNDTKE